MKKPFSVILSLVLLMSSLAIPMTVSAGGTLTADEAYAQLNAAVNNLVPNPNLYSSVANLNFFAQPAGSAATVVVGENSVVGSVEIDGEPTEINEITTRETNPALEPNLGDSAIKIKNNYTVTSNIQGLHQGDLHAVRFNKNGDVAVKGTGQTDVCINEIGYLVFYVKTNRDLKLTFGSHNYSNQAISILNGETAKTVNATDGVYQPVVIDFNDIDWPTVAAKTYHASSTVWSSFIGIEEIAGEPAGTITPDDQIEFGSMYYIPVDTAVRDFKYNLIIDNSSNGEVQKKHDELSGDMIADAEMITNDGGRYTAESFAELQTAIVNAKASYLASADIDGIKALLSSELANAGTVEEIWRPTFNLDTTDNKWHESENAIGDDAIARYKSLFGSYAAKQDSTHTKVSFVKDGVANANGDSVPTNLSVYDDMWLYAYNNSSAPITPSSFGVITTNSNTLSLEPQKLNPGINRIELFGAKPFWDNIGISSTDYATFKDIVKDPTIDNAAWNTNRLQINPDTFDAGASVIYGTIFGLRALDKTELSSADSLVKIVDFYDNYIKGKGLSNVENATITFETLKNRFTSVRTVPFNDDTTVNCTGEYTLDNAIEGQHVSFTVKVENGGSVTSVTYGSEEITADNDVYKITVDNAKTLEIKTTRDGYAPVGGMLTVDGGVQRDIIDHSTANNHPTWSQNKDTLNNKTETVVYQEPVLFYTDDGQVRSNVKLMYPVENIVAVTSYTTIDGAFKWYREGTDFTVNNDGTISLTADSSIPHNIILDEIKNGIGDSGIWNSAGTWNTQLPKNQVLVTYTYTKTWDGVDYSVPTYANSLSTAYEKLNNEENLNVLFIGDSITTGCNTSGQDGTFYSYTADAVGSTTVFNGWSKYLGLSSKPYWVNDSWDKQVVANLEKAYPDATINWVNRAVASSHSQWYFNHIDELLVTGSLGDVNLANTDLVFIGFGMNEKSSTKETHKANIKKIIDYLRQKNSNVSIVLVSAFYPTFWNASGKYWDNACLADHEDGYFELAKEYNNIAVAPVNTAFTNVLDIKEGVDYIANGINHPNDFGANLYADTITSTLINSATVTAPKALELLTNGIVDGTGNSAGKQTTAIYLLAEYDTPMYAGGKTANPKKIILDDGNVAGVVSRTFYVASKSVYDNLANKDDFGKTNVAGVKQVTLTGQDLAKYWKKYPIDGTNNATISFGVGIKNITKNQKDNAFAVRAKVEYRLGNGGYVHTVYSDVQTTDNFSAQGAYDILKSQGKQPPFWFNTDYDDGSADGDNFFG